MRLDLAAPAAAGNVGIDWSRLARRVIIVGAAVFAVAQLYIQARGSEYGIDFRGATWQAARTLLAGHSPYAPASSAALLHLGNGFVNSPLLGELGVPFAPLPFPVAIVAFDAVCVLALSAALWVLEVRDWRVYALSLCCFPFVSSLVLGQPDPLLALLAAIAWRYRDSWPGALAVGALIASKFLPWPLVVWLLVTRRFRQAAIAIASVPVLLIAGWAGIRFNGLTGYARLVAADARAFETRSHSLLAAFAHTGLSLPFATLLGTATAVAIAAAVVVVSRRSDLGWFTAALALSLLSGPILWQHYLVLLLVPLVAQRRRHPDLAAWLCVALLWLSPTETPSTLWQGWLIPLLVCAIVIRIAILARLDRPEAARGERGPSLTRPAPATPPPTLA